MRLCLRLLRIGGSNSCVVWELETEKGRKDIITQEQLDLNKQIAQKSGTGSVYHDLGMYGRFFICVCVCVFP